MSDGKTFPTPRFWVELNQLLSAQGSKSETAKALAERLGLPFIDVPVSTVNPADFPGIPTAAVSIFGPPGVGKSVFVPLEQSGSMGPAAELPTMGGTFPTPESWSKVTEIQSRGGGTQPINFVIFTDGDPE